MPTPNRFSVKSEMFLTTKSKKPSMVDGPWKPTVEEAIAAYVERVNRKGFHTRRVLRPFVAERATSETGGSQDTNRVFYNTNREETLTIASRLVEAGLLL